MAQEWWRSLPADERREYERSAGLEKIALAPDPRFARIVQGVDQSLAADDRQATERASQALVDGVSRGLSIPTATIRVQGRRPPDGDGELHGIYRPAEGDERDQISVWMRTAKREDVVATRTFLRTLLHEVVHHVDMRLLELPNSFHTKGFYQRESSLFRIVTKGTPLAPKRGRGRSAAPAPRKPPPPPKEADVQRGLALLRAAADDIASKRKKDGA